MAQRALVDADGTLVAPRARLAPEQLGVMAMGAALVCAVVVSEVVEAWRQGLARLSRLGYSAMGMAHGAGTLERTPSQHARLIFELLAVVAVWTRIPFTRATAEVVEAWKEIA